MKLHRRLISALTLTSLLCAANIALALSSTQDTDGDGLNDAAEDANGNDVMDAGETDPYNVDTDRGGESDGTEARAHRNPLDPADDMTADTDGDGWVNGIEILNNTDPKSPDTDGDGLTDPNDDFPLDSRYQEDRNTNGLPDEWEKKNGLSESQATPMKSDDPDGDGLKNAEEFARGTDPLGTDTDRDGIDDFTELNAGDDPREHACLEYRENNELFDDADESDWGFPFIKQLRSVLILPDRTHIIRGYDDGNRTVFRPGQPVTRFEFLKMTVLSTCTKLRNSTDDERVNFSDVKNSTIINESPDIAQRRKVIYTAVHHGIVKGYADGTFKPDAPVNRAEALKILSLAARLGTFASSGAVMLSFSDVTGDEWFAPYLVEAVSRSIVEGYPDGSFGPERPITRVEATKIILLTVRQNPTVNGYILPE